MDIFWIPDPDPDPDPHNNRCGSATLQWEGQNILSTACACSVAEPHKAANFKAALEPIFGPSELRAGAKITGGSGWIFLKERKKESLESSFFCLEPESAPDVQSRSRPKKWRLRNTGLSWYYMDRYRLTTFSSSSNKENRKINVFLKMIMYRCGTGTDYFSVDLVRWHFFLNAVNYCFLIPSFTKPGYIQYPDSCLLKDLDPEKKSYRYWSDISGSIHNPIINKFMRTPFLPPWFVSSFSMRIGRI